MVTWSKSPNFCVAVMPDRPLDSVALDLMARSRVADLKANGDELARLVRETLRPLPALPLDPVAREQVLAILLLQARDRGRRLLTLIALAQFSDQGFG